MSYYRKHYEYEDLSHRSKAVYIYLYDRYNKEKKCWSSLKTIARGLSFSQSTVRRAIQDLEKAKLVRKEFAYRKTVKTVHIQATGTMLFRIRCGKH